MCHRAFLMSQTRLAATSGRRHKHTNFNRIMTTKQISYRNVTTNNTTANANKVFAETAAAAEATPEPPTARQLATHAVKCAIPMIGFGFMVRGFTLFTS